MAATIATTLNTYALTPVNLRRTDLNVLTSVPIRRFFGGSSLSQRNARSSRSGNAPVLPVIKAQDAPGTFYLYTEFWYKLTDLVLMDVLIDHRCRIFA